MPEGDSLYKLAAELRRALVGQRLTELWLRDRGRVDALSHARVAEASTVGKHLLIGLAPGDETTPPWVLHVHLGMHGRVDRYRPGEAWRRPAYQASFRLETERLVQVGFKVARAELVPTAALAFHPALSRLGPDLLAPSFPTARAVQRARAQAPPTAADLLLDQRVACGLGNVYKSELLFRARIHPRARGAELRDDQIAALFEDGRRLLRQNLGIWPRTTLRPVEREEDAPRRGEPRFFVYDRAGLPCWECGARIVVARVGDMARPTWWCPRCQPEPQRESSRAPGESGTPAFR